MMVADHQIVMVTLTCSAFLSIAVLTDLSRRIIPNTLTVAALSGGLLYHLFRAWSVDGLLFSFSGLLTGGLLLFLPYRFALTGAGDVKLLAALGAWLGPMEIARVFIYSTLAGGIMAATQIIHRRWQAQNHPSMEMGVEKKRSATSPRPGLPYALAIGTGYAVFLIWGRQL